MTHTIRTVFDDAALRSAISELTPALRRRVFVAGLSAMARVVRRQARIRGYGFTDRTGRLRRTIRASAAPGPRRGNPRRQVVIGGPGARQGFLIEEGHGGPRPARPYRTVSRALRETGAEQAAAWQTVVRARLPAALDQARRRGARRRTRRR